VGSGGNQLAVKGKLRQKMATLVVELRKNSHQGE